MSDTATPKLTYDAIQAVIDEYAAKATTDAGRYRIEDVGINLAGYAEPGYDDPASGAVCTGDWNTISEWDKEQNKFVDKDTAPADLSNALAELGVELEWCDEWTTCQDCGKLIRTQPNSYGWQKSYAETDEGEICHHCLQKDPTGFLRELEGQDTKCNTIETIKPADHGYVLLEDKYDNGFYPGADADPKKIGKALRAQGIERYLFQLDEVSQFNVRFSVFVHKDEIEKLNQEAFAEADKSQKPSPSENLQKGLRNVPPVTEKPDGIAVVVNHIDIDTGDVTTDYLTPDQFARGVRPPDSSVVVGE